MSRAEEKVLRDEKGKPYVGGPKVSNGFADQYQKTATGKNPKRTLPRVRVASAKHRVINRWEFEAALNKMGSHKQVGPDLIPIEFIKWAPEVLREELRQLMNQSLLTGDIPSRWKQGVVSPQHKPAKDAGKFTSYRPVTLTSHVAKLMERIISRRIIFKIHKTMECSQYGFKKSVGTVDALMEIVDFISQATDTDPGGDKQLGAALAVLIDFTSAFDTVDHAYLISVLKHKKAPRYETRWVRQFIQNRSTVVRVGESESSSRRFTSGVPQGTVLGPLMFVIAMDPMLHKLRCLEINDGMVKSGSTSAFADDISCLAGSLDPRGMYASANMMLEVVHEGAEAAGLKLSFDKTKAIEICRGEYNTTEPKELYYGGKKITVITRGEKPHTEKVLGFMLGTDGTHVPHVKFITENAKLALRGLYPVAGRNGNGLFRSQLKMLASGLALSKLTYGLKIIYGDLEPKHREELDKVHESVARLVAGTSLGAATQDTYSEAHMVPLSYDMKAAQALAAIRVLALDDVSGDQKEALLSSTGTGGRTTRSNTVGNSVYPAMHSEAIELAPMLKLVKVARIVQYGKINPGTTGFEGVEFHPSLGRTREECNHDKTVMREVSLEAIRSRNLDYIIYADGASNVVHHHSQYEDLGAGGGWAIWSAETGQVLLGNLAAGVLTTAKNAEKVAVAGALKHFFSLRLTPGRVGVCWDCQEGITDQQKGPLEQTTRAGQAAWVTTLRLVKKDFTVVYQHIFAHVDIDLHDRADRQAKIGKAKSQQGVPIEHSDWVSFVNAHKMRLWQEELQRSAKRDGCSPRIKHYGTGAPSAEENRMPWEKLVLTVGVKVRLLDWFGLEARKWDPKLMRECRLCADPIDQEDWEEKEAVTTTSYACGGCGKKVRPAQKTCGLHKCAGTRVKKVTTTIRNSGRMKTHTCTCGATGKWEDEDWSHHLATKSTCQEILYLCYCQYAAPSVASRGAHMGKMNSIDGGGHFPIENASEAQKLALLDRLFCSCGRFFNNTKRRADHQRQQKDGGHRDVSAEVGLAMIRENSITKYKRQLAVGSVEDFPHLTKCTKLSSVKTDKPFDALGLQDQVKLSEEFRKKLGEEGWL